MAPPESAGCRCRSRWGGRFGAQSMHRIFVDDRLVAARCPEWLQSSFTILINHFKCISLRTSSKKTTVMRCLPGKIRVAQTKALEHQRQSVNVLSVRSVAPALPKPLRDPAPHLPVIWSFILIWDIIVARPPEVYRAAESPATGTYFCPVPQCGGQLGTRFNLRCHFLMRHLQDLVCILIEGSHPLPQRKQCGLQKPVEYLDGGHRRTELCQQGCERKRPHAAAVHSQEALGCSFTAYGEEWRFFNTWGGSLYTMMPIPKPCGQICRKYGGAGLRSRVC